jgi:hypothetical protein
MVTVEPDRTLRRFGTWPWTVLLARPLIVTIIPARAVGTLLKWLPALISPGRSGSLRLRWSLALLTAAK